MKRLFLLVCLSTLLVTTGLPATIEVPEAPAWMLLRSQGNGGVTPTYYYTGGADSYNDTMVENGGYAVCADIIVDQSADMSSLGIKVNGTSEDDFKVAVYNTSGSLLHNCGEQTASISSGWNDVSCGSSYAVSSGTYRLCAVFNATHTTLYHNNSGTGYWAVAPYSGFPQATLSLNSDSGKTNALRGYVE